MEAEKKELLRVSGLSVCFGKKAETCVVKDVSFSVNEGEILGIVGESGSGKSMTALSVMGLLPEGASYTANAIRFDGTDLLQIGEKEYCKLRGSRLAMIFQEPMTSLNPVLTIEKQVEEPLLLHKGGDSGKEERRQAVLAALTQAGLKQPETLLKRYPHQLSGGQRQRVMIAMAMLCGPKLLIADEPTTALDVTTEEQILQLLKKLSEEYKTAVLFISHNLGVIRRLCGRTLVMKDGRIVEQGETKRLFAEPKESYTRQLLASIPSGAKENASKAKQTKAEPFLSLEQVNAYYEEQGPLLGRTKRKQVVSQVSFTIREGEIVGLVGESGSGKTTLVKAIAGLHRFYDGKIKLKQDLTRIQMVFQDPYTSLNPAKKIGWILEEPLRFGTGLKKKERKRRAIEMLREVELPEEYYGRYVSELSGGQRQRVAIAAALIRRPQFVLLDEPVSALDVTVQAQILRLLLKLQREHSLTYLFISHDMNVIRKLCDRVLVMYKGEIIEAGETEAVFASPKEAYTKELIAAAGVQEGNPVR